MENISGSHSFNNERCTQRLEYTLTIPTEFSIFECGWKNCDFKFEFHSDFKDHVQTIHLTSYRSPPPNNNDSLNSNFYCEWNLCSFSTSHSSEIHRHVIFHIFHTKIKILGLQLAKDNNLGACYFDSSQRNTLPNLREKLKCEWKNCSRIFDDCEEFYEHVSTHGENIRGENTPYFCNWISCTSSFKTISKIKEHLRVHSQEKFAACPQCGSLFANRVKFLDHRIRQLPSLSKKFQCSYCFKKFGVERLLRDHMRSHINTTQCPYCPMTTTTSSNLESHIAYRHSNEKPFSCTQCSFSSKSASDLHSHEQSIHNEVKFTCSKCSFSCSSKKTLTHHVCEGMSEKEKNNPLYHCHECSKTFARGNYLSKHLLRVHKLKIPEGHRRFQYRKGDEGHFHLLTERINYLVHDDDSQISS